MNNILHIDADSFFASVEVANNPLLRGKAVCVTGAQGGCVLASSYEAKAKGVTTGMPKFKAEKLFKKGEVIFIPTTFGRYAQYSEKMFSIFHMFTPDVEEASVDEAYLDMHGLRRLYRKSYSEMARDIQARVKSSLDLPVSVGVGPTKTLSKMASKYAKPFGVYEVPKKSIQDFLATQELGHVPGFGKPSVALLHKYGIQTLEQFTSLSESNVQQMMGKMGVILWNELQGVPMYKVEQRFEDPKSLSRIRSFSLTDNKDFLLQQLLQHIVVCSYKLRKKNLIASKMFIYVRTKHFEQKGIEIKLQSPHMSSMSLASEAIPRFTQIIVQAGLVRATGLILTNLRKNEARQASLFDSDNVPLAQEVLLKAADTLNDKYGMYTVRPASLFDLPVRKNQLPWMLN